MKKTLKYQVWQLSLSMSVILTSLAFGTQTKAQLLPYGGIFLSQNTVNSLTPTLSALDIFRKAYENRYTWNPKFPGYTADVELKQGKEGYRGNILVKPDMSVQVTGIDKEEARQMVEISLQTMANQHRRISFKEAHKNSTFKFDTTNKNGVIEIIEQGEKAETRYKIIQNQLTQINRVFGNTAVTVDVLASEKTSEGYLATRYRSTFQQPQTKQVTRVEEGKDNYKLFGDYYLLTYHLVEDSQQGQLTNTAEFNYTHIRLLS